MIALAIEADGLLDESRHPNTGKDSNQSVLVVAFDNYVYLAPYIEEKGELKSTSPSKAKFKAAATATLSKKNGATFACPRPT